MFILFVFLSYHDLYFRIITVIFNHLFVHVMSADHWLAVCPPAMVAFFVLLFCVCSFSSHFYFAVSSLLLLVVFCAWPTNKPQKIIRRCEVWTASPSSSTSSSSSCYIYQFEISFSESEHLLVSVVCIPAQIHKHHTPAPPSSIGIECA